jgi:septum formation protein
LEHLSSLLDIDISAQESGYAEDLPMDMDPRIYCQETARHKTNHVFDRMEVPAIVVGCDTMILSQGKIIGKAQSKEEAKAILSSFSNNSHVCLTGVTVRSKDKVVEWVSESRVVFGDITALIDPYLASEEWVGKAGAYGIQGSASLFVKEIEGCFYNIVGLPLQRLTQVLIQDFGVLHKS